MVDSLAANIPAISDEKLRARILNVSWTRKFMKKHTYKIIAWNSENYKQIVQDMSNNFLINCYNISIEVHNLQSFRKISCKILTTLVMSRVNDFWKHRQVLAEAEKLQMRMVHLKYHWGNVRYTQIRNLIYKMGFHLHH